MKKLLTICWMAGLAMVADTGAAPFADPAPPTVDEKVVEAEAKPAAYEGLKFHAAPKPLARDAVSNDWPRFLGPANNSTSTETKLVKNLPAKLPVVWEAKKGTGYCAPAIVGDRLILFHRVADEEVIDCLQADTGLRFWQVKYATAYQDRYGYCDGPRASPVIDEGRVYAIGAEGVLSCLDLKTGHLFWRRKLLEEFKVSQNFFGVGSTPLVEGNLLIVNLGAPGGPSVAAFDKKDGKMVWGAGEQWGPSYASPVPAVLHGKRRVLVFAGGESNPPTGGLMSIDPLTGKEDFSFPWRSKSYESVNASCPVIFDDKVFVSASYKTGGALLEVKPDFT